MSKTLVERTKSIIDKTEELKKDYMDMLGSDVWELDAPEFGLIKKSIELIDESYDLYMHYALVMDSMNKKLDNLTEAMDKLLKK